MSWVISHAISAVKSETPQLGATESLCELVNGLLFTQLDHVIEGARL
jgi:hypothetical protein